MITIVRHEYYYFSVKTEHHLIELFGYLYTLEQNSVTTHLEYSLRLAHLNWWQNLMFY